MWRCGGGAARVPAAGGGEALHQPPAQHAHTPRHPRHQGYLHSGDYHGDIIYGGPGVKNDDWSATLNLLLFLFSGGSLYTNQRQQRRRPHKLLFQLSFA